MANNDQFQTTVLAELQALRKQVAELQGNQASSKPARKSSTPSDPAEKKERKPRAPTSWDAFRAAVQTALSEGGLKANAMSYASYLRKTYGEEEAYGMDAQAITAAFPDYTPPEPKPRKPKAKAEAAAEGEEKPKRTITPEHLAKMQAGAAAKRARDKAEKEASQAESEPEASPKAPSPKPAAPKAASLTPLPFRGKRLVWDPATNGTWLRGPDAEDGTPTKGAWFGVLGADKKSVDTNAPAPQA